MSVRHIDFLKIKPSKCLMVEIRPVRCYVETSSGKTKTAKWMSYEHWKELRILLNDITTSYEESKMIGSTGEIKCNEYKMKDGQNIKIGYMFVAHNSYQCHFLMPKDNATWTDDEDDDDDAEEYQRLKDKGGKYRALIPCAERLVVSVRLQSQASQLEIPADKQLFKTLDSSFVVTNTISDYFSSSQKQCIDSESSSLQLRCNERKKVKNMTVKPKQKSLVLPPDSDQNKRLRKKSIFDSSSEELTDDGDDLVLKQLGQVQAPLCSGRDSVYQAFREKDIDVNINCENPMSIMNEWIKTRRKSGLNDSLENTDTEIPSLSDEPQGSDNNTQSFIGGIIKAGRSYLGDVALGVKSDNTNENEFSSCQNFSDEYEVPLSYSPENEQLSCEFDNEGFGCNYSSDYQAEVGEIFEDNEIGEDNTTVFYNKEDDIERYVLCCKNTLLNDDSLEAKNFGLVQEKSSNELNMSSVTLNRKSQLCETVDSALTKTTLSSDFVFSSEHVNDLGGQNIGKAQNLKKEKAVGLNIADQKKDEVSFWSKNKSESVSVDPQNVVGWDKKKPCSNSEISEGIGNDLGHCSKTEEESSEKNVSEQFKEKSIIETKKAVTNAKQRQKTRSNRQKGKRKFGFFESEKTREGKKILREVMKEIEEVRKRKLEESLLLANVSQSPSLDYNFKTKGIQEVKKGKKSAACKRIKRPASQPTMRDFLLKKITVDAAEKEHTKKFSIEKESSDEFECDNMHKNVSWSRSVKRKALQEDKETMENYNQKRLSTSDIFADSSEMSDISISCHGEESEKNESLGRKLFDDINFPNKDSEMENECRRLSSLSFLENNSSGQDETSVSVHMDPVSNLPSSFSIDESFQVLMESAPQIDHLRKCKSKLTAIPVSELSERLEDAHEYLKGIISEKIFSEKHQIFKGNSKDCRDLLNIEVYAVFEEEQSEFMIDLMREKYFEKLQSSIKDRNVRRQYIWKVLVPSFFVKLAMDVLNISSEKETEKELMEICMNLDD
ncbi:uncharacterized protein LOC135216777 [Macrobrachium nipponense]|uniref:uncharacterized protein LOC135216777 n=1 Tax=Macrobrachium nipponense TaxID=159736 RepID=UPI0030C7F0DE